MRPFYTVGELARLMSGDAPERYGREHYKRAWRMVESAQVPIRSLPRPEGRKPIRVVYLCDIRDQWPELYDSIALAQMQSTTCKACGHALRCGCEGTAKRDGERDVLPDAWAGDVD